MDELWDDYLQFLIWRGGIHNMRKYSRKDDRLFEILHHINFEYILERDENREADGIDLRLLYTIPPDFDLNIKGAFYDQKCSVLEMLIALSIRVDNEFIGDPAEEHPEIFFSEMLKNLGLYPGFDERGIDKIIDRWLYRRFDRDGTGSPFPVKYDHADQRKLEIWDQMLSYINENYN